jgi:activator of HSP90 ATPase
MLTTAASKRDTLPARARPCQYLIDMTTIRQRVRLDASPSDVFEMLMNSSRHARFTGEPATIRRRAGGSFSAYGGYITGVNVEIVPNRRIVQAWRGSDWPKGVYSIAMFELAPLGGRRTVLTFTQHGVPRGHVRSIRQGWIDFYWEPMKADIRAHSAKASGGALVRVRRARGG